MTDSTDKTKAGGLLELVGSRRGHFELESGHHGELWLDLDGLFLKPAKLTPFIDELGARLDACRPDGICGPALGGALIAMSIAEQLDTDFFVAERVAVSPGTAQLFTAHYAVADAVRGHLEGRRIAVVDDVVNAGSATRATVADMRDAGAHVVAIGALLVLGDAAERYARAQAIELTAVATLPNRLWEPDDCPMCIAGDRLERLVPPGP
jgi:orotate phosphoribosyltransferase